MYALASNASSTRTRVIRDCRSPLRFFRLIEPQSLLQCPERAVPGSVRTRSANWAYRHPFGSQPRSPPTPPDQTTHRLRYRRPALGMDQRSTDAGGSHRAPASGASGPGQRWPPTGRPQRMSESSVNRRTLKERSGSQEDGFDRLCGFSWSRRAAGGPAQQVPRCLWLGAISLEPGFSQTLPWGRK